MWISVDCGTCVHSVIHSHCQAEHLWAATTCLLVLQGLMSGFLCSMSSSNSSEFFFLFVFCLFDCLFFNLEPFLSFICCPTYLAFSWYFKFFRCTNSNNEHLRCCYHWALCVCPYTSYVIHPLTWRPFSGIQTGRYRLKEYIFPYPFYLDKKRTNSFLVIRQKSEKELKD